MVRMTVLAMVIAGCGGRGESERGPAYTPGMGLALHGIAPDCTVKKTPGEAIQVVHTCRGPIGTVTVQLADGSHLHTVDIALRSALLPQAIAHFEPALTPLLGAPSVATFVEQLRKMRTGDHLELALAGATLSVTAGGTSQMAPEYAVTLTW